MTNTRYLLSLSIITLALTMSACGGGGGSDGDSDEKNEDGVSATTAEGIWVGNITGEGFNEEIIGAISPEGESFFLNIDSLELYTFPTLDGTSSVEGTVRAYAPFGSVYDETGDGVATYDVTGNIEAKSTFTGEVSSGASFDVRYQADEYETATSLSQVTGDWQGMVDDGGNINFNISTEGAITGLVSYENSTEECTVTGAFSDIEPETNLYHTSVDIGGSACNEGEYTGLGFIYEDSSGVYLLLGVSKLDAGAAIQAQKM